MKLKTLCRCVLLLMAISILSGCGGETYAPELGSVTGKVTMEGKPLADATVTFIPADGPPSAAITDASGTYRLKFKNGADGALPGKHTVTISTDKDGSGAAETVPAKYNKNTTLTAEVKAGENPPIDFEL